MFTVKICGITNLTDAVAACQAGADALGFIFYPGSSRYIAREAAQKIIADLPDRIQKIGVFVNEDIDTLNGDYGFLDRAQLHGDEPPDYCERVVLPVIKVFRMHAAVAAAQFVRFDGYDFLLDTYAPAQRGGTGAVFDWRMARGIKRSGRLILSGGLNPDNVAEAVRVVQPDAIDLCSGVEASPGKKDPEKLRRLFQVLAGTDWQAHAA